MRPIDLYYKAPYFIRYPIFIATGALQAYGRYGAGFKKNYDDLMNNNFLSENEIVDLQNQYMRRLLHHAYNHVPYYKRMFDNLGFLPDDYKDKRDLEKLPILTKDIIKNNFDDLIADNVSKNKRTLHTSGGTTGKPFAFYLSNELKRDFNYATLYRFYSWAGVKFGEPRVSIAGRLITKRPPYAMKNLAENQLYICAHYLTEENLGDIVSSILKFRPSFIQGHPSAIAVVAHHMKHTGTQVPVKAVFTTSENLYLDQRTVIEEAFSCKVFDTYGMGELVAMASECSQHNGYHLAPEYGITEIVNSELYNDGFGEIISTSLQNYAMPMIRYKTGDLGKLSARLCTCGCKFPMLESISGRIDDIIKLRDGKIILPLTLRITMKNAGIADFQIIQEQSGILRVNILGSFEENNKHLLVSKTKKSIEGDFRRN